MVVIIRRWLKKIWQQWFAAPDIITAESTYSRNSFISHFSGFQLETLFDQQGHALFQQRDTLPTITVHPMAQVSSGGGVSLLKLINNQERSSHVLRMATTNSLSAVKEQYHRQQRVQRRLGPYVVPLLHHRYVAKKQGSEVVAHYFHESEYINHLDSAYDYLRKKANNRAEQGEALLRLTQQMITLCRYLQHRRIVWSDFKPENIFIDPRSHRLRLPDTKNMFTRRNKLLPLNAFTQDYMAPALRGKSHACGSRAVSASDFPLQQHYSMMKSIDNLLALCDDSQATVQVVREYWQAMQAQGSLFSPAKALNQQARVLLQNAKGDRLMAQQSHRRWLRCFHRHSSTANIHNMLEMKVVSQAEDSVVSAGQSVPPTLVR